MTEDSEKGPLIIESHQELVKRIERSAGRMRALSAVTVLVAAVLAVAYVSQLALPLSGTRVVSVNLADPANVASELIVLGLALAWLYVGVSDFRFSTRMRAEIRGARADERAIQKEIEGSD